MTTLEKIRAKIQKVLDTERDFTSENAKAQALALNWVLELFDKYAEQEPTTRQSCENCKQDPKECENDDHYGFCQNWEYAEQAPCDKCKYFDGNCCQYYDYKVGYTQGYEDASERFRQEPCDDAISREAVLTIASIHTLTVDETVKAIKNLPSVRSQEPKTGHWIGIDEEPHEDYECDKCGYVVSTYTANIEPHTEYKFCPNCGARMERSDKE